MLKIFILSVCLAVVIAHDGKSKIVGGDNVGELVGKKVVNNGEFPFMAQIKLKQPGKRNLPHCSASIVALNVLLTAAHCLDGKSPEDFVIFAGNVKKGFSAGSQRRLVQQFLIHENYTNTYKPPRNDIAMIFLTKPFKATKFVRPIEGANLDDYEIGSKVTTIGWGIDEFGENPKWLQKTDLFLISNSKCQEHVNKDYKNVWQVTDDMVCAIKQNDSAACEGDSGGPLIYNNKLLGTNSFSFTTLDYLTENMICDTFYPTGFVRISNYLDWIYASE